MQANLDRFDCPQGIADRQVKEIRIAHCDPLHSSTGIPTSIWTGLQPGRFNSHPTKFHQVLVTNSQMRIWATCADCLARPSRDHSASARAIVLERPQRVAALFEFRPLNSQTSNHLDCLNCSS